MSLNTKFDELLEFPCQFSFKAIGHADPALPDRLLVVLQEHIPGDYSPSVQPSSKGTYHSVTLRATVVSKEQVETLYIELAKVDGVIRVL